MTPPVLAVCGKGGVGKTALSALLARALIEQGRNPLLLIDADPAGGLVSAVGERVVGTLSSARRELVTQARQAAAESDREQLAARIDYLVMQTLAERSEYALLAMGRDIEKGCFCPANTLLRSAIDVLASAYAAVLIDAEAGLEQINRQVTRRVETYLVICDGSKRSFDTLATIAQMIETGTLAVIANRSPADTPPPNLADMQWLGTVPEDAELRHFDTEGRSLWELPPANPAFAAMRGIAKKLSQIWTNESAGAIRA